jgi:hypothetical protein
MLPELEADSTGGPSGDIKVPWDETGFLRMLWLVWSCETRDRPESAEDVCE